LADLPAIKNLSGPLNKIGSAFSSGITGSPFSFPPIYLLNSTFLI